MCVISLLQVIAHTGHIELTKLLTLKQYLHIYNEIKRHVSDATDAAAVVSPDAVDTQRANMLDASVIMMQYVACYCGCVFMSFLKFSYCS